MNGVVKFFMAVAMLLVLGGEGVANAVPDHDHHTRAELAEGPMEAPDADHGNHMIHGCGVCHHLVDGRSLVVAIEVEVSDHKYDFIAERVSSRALEPPFQPPIEISV